jgi:hypothetical protein
MTGAAATSAAAGPAPRVETGIAPTETLKLEPDCRAELALEGRRVQGESCKFSAGGT